MTREKKDLNSTKAEESYPSTYQFTIPYIQEVLRQRDSLDPDVEEEADTYLQNFDEYTRNNPIYLPGAAYLNVSSKMLSGGPGRPSKPYSNIIKDCPGAEKLLKDVGYKSFSAASLFPPILSYNFVQGVVEMIFAPSEDIRRYLIKIGLEKEYDGVREEDILVFTQIVRLMVEKYFIDREIGSQFLKEL